MEEKDFLKYLLATHKISNEEAKECWQECLSKQQKIEETLLKGNYLTYFTPALLKQYMLEFEDHYAKINPENSEKLEKLATSEENLLEEIKQFSFGKEQFLTPSTETLIERAPSKEETTVFPSQKLLNKIPLVQKERYQLLRTLGEGGMGVVQLVKDNLLGREVALKKIKTRRSDFKKLSLGEKAMLWRLNKEAEITAILEHPNIVPLYEMQQYPLATPLTSSGDHSGREGEVCFTMRKVAGRTLRKILKEKREHLTRFDYSEEYDEGKLLGIYLKVCDAMTYAHNQGVVHRDLKPENIMVGQFGEVYVMDWGIAKKLKGESYSKAEEIPQNLSVEVEEKINSKAIAHSQEEELLEKIAVGNSRIIEEMKTIGGMGTEGYMAPEQRENAIKVTFQSDIYSLGQILRECFVLLSPWEEFQEQIQNDNRRREQEEHQKKRKRKGV